MLSLRSQEQESSYAEWSAWSPPGNLVSGHSLTMCNIVCLLPLAQSGLSRMPQSWRVAAYWPQPVRTRLRRVQSLRSRSKPDKQMAGSVIRNWLDTCTSFLNQSSFQASQTHQSMGGSVHTNEQSLQVYQLLGLL